MGIDEPIRMTVVESIADISGDGLVNIDDLRTMADAWLVESGDAGFNYNADLERDGKIDNADVDILSENWIISSPAVVYKAYYYHFDGLGSVIALTDSSGKVVESYHYTVYGQADKISNIGNPYMFTGREYDAETGLYYYRARMYNPGIGRFMQTDPVGYSVGINWYVYCGNNPVVLVDPYGNLYIRGKISDVYTNPFITVVTEDGAVHTYQIRSRAEFKLALTDYASPDNRITRLDIVGHGLEGELYTKETILGGGKGMTGLLYQPSEKIKEAYANANLKLPVDLIDTVQSRFATNAEINLRFCQSALGEQSLGRGFKQILPKSTIRGYTGNIWPIGVRGSVGIFNRMTEIKK